MSNVKPAKIYPFTLGAFEALPLIVQGSYFKVLSSTGAVDVTGDSFGSIEALLAGQGLRGQGYSRLTIRDRSGSPNMVRLLVSDDLFVDDRITGEVSVVDGNKSRSIAGAAMGWRMTSAGGAAGNFAMAQIWNPVGTGRRVVVDAMLIGAAAGGPADVAWGLSAVRLDTASAYQVVSMSSAAPASTVAEPRVQGSLAVPATAIAGGAYVQAGTPLRVKFERPFIVNPGTGFTVMAGAGAAVQSLTGGLEFFEESIL